MRVLFALIIGITLGAAGFWVGTSRQGRAGMQAARDAIQEKLKLVDLRTNDIKDELAHTGQVIRRSAKETGQAIADATADARTTTAIKTKLFASHELSGLSISVNTTAGVVTLSGTVPSTEAISKAMLLAMETGGVREVISTLQVKPTK
jgi:hypothetical protein